MSRVINVVARMDPYETVQSITVNDDADLDAISAGLVEEGYEVVGLEYELDLDDDEEYEHGVSW